MKKKRYVALARVSSREQEREGFSLDIQEDALNAFAEIEGGKVSKMFRIAETASKQRERKVFQELLTFLKRHAADVDGLLVYKVDRAVRNLVDLVELENIEHEYEIPLVCITQRTDNSPTGRLLRRILALLGAFQTEQQSVDVREGLARRVAEGLFPQKAPFGYASIRVDGRGLVRVHADNGPKAKRIFQLYAYHGHTVDSLSERLAEEGITYQPSRPRFYRSSLHRLLRNRAYIGEVDFRGKWYPGTHEPLVDMETWSRVQQLLGDRKYQSAEKTYSGELIECGYCGRAITGEKAKGKYFYYRCTRYNKDEHPRIRMKEADLDQQVFGLFDQLVVDDEDIRDWLSTVRKQKAHAGQQYQRKRRTELLRQLTAATNQQKRLVSLRLNGEIDEDAMRDHKAELQGRAVQLTSAIEEIDRSLSAVADDADPRGISRLLRDCWTRADVGIKRRILNGLFHNCRLEGRTLIPKWRQPFDVIAKLA